MDNPEGKSIEGRELTSEDVGSKVTYIPTHANNDVSHEDCEGGHIKRWNNGGVFVIYKSNTCHTRFNDLVWG